MSLWIQKKISGIEFPDAYICYTTIIIKKHNQALLEQLLKTINLDDILLFGR